MVHLGAHAVFCRLHGPCPAAFAAVTGVKLTTAPLTPAGRTAAPSAIPPRVPAIPPRSLAHGRVLLDRRTALS